MHKLNFFSSFGLTFDVDVTRPCELYIDMFPSTTKNSIRILWSLEPNEISGLRDIVINRHKEFDLILTWHKEVIDNCPNAKLYPHGTSWISNFDLTKEKEYCVTSIVGGKRITANHTIRQEFPSVTDQITSIPLHLFNSRNNPYIGEPKIDRFIKDSIMKNELFYSQYHVAIENVCQPNYFSEKLVDCFQTNTVPIYLGCPNIGDFFDIRGMFIVNTLEDIISVCNSITPETYNQMLPYVLENYKRSVKYANFRETLRDEMTEFVKNY